jgi:hypothetical protein
LFLGSVILLNTDQGFFEILTKPLEKEQTQNSGEEINSEGNTASPNYSSCLKLLQSDDFLAYVLSSVASHLALIHRGTHPFYTSRFLFILCNQLYPFYRESVGVVISRSLTLSILCLIVLNDLHRSAVSFQLSSPGNSFSCASSFFSSFDTSVSGALLLLSTSFATLNFLFIPFPPLTNSLGFAFTSTYNEIYNSDIFNPLEQIFKSINKSEMFEVFCDCIATVSGKFGVLGLLEKQKSLFDKNRGSVRSQIDNEEREEKRKKKIKDVIKQNSAIQSVLEYLRRIFNLKWVSIFFDDPISDFTSGFSNYGLTQSCVVFPLQHEIRGFDSVDYYFFQNKLN